MRYLPKCIGRNDADQDEFIAGRLLDLRQRCLSRRTDFCENGKRLPTPFPVRPMEHVNERRHRNVSTVGEAPQDSCRIDADTDIIVLE